MKKLIFSLLAALLSISVYAQVEYEKGWIVDNEGNRVECLIRNKGWRTSPKSFEYKIEDGKTLVGDVETVSEFGVGNYHFISKEVDIDTSRPSVDNYSKGSAPVLSRMKVYLAVLCDGPYKLYSYKSGSFNDSYYYSLNDSDPEYLIHKHYLGASGRVMENNYFRQQLIKALEGTDTGKMAIERLPYNEKNLVNLFTQLNGKGRNETKDWGSISMNVFAGAGVVTSNFKNHSTRPRQYFGPDFTVKAAGADLEYTFPFYRKKLSILISPEVYSFSQESYWKPVASPEVKEWVKYSTVNIPISLRYKMFCGKNTYFYLDLGASVGYPFNTDINVTDFQYEKIKHSYNLLCGAGINLYDRVSIGLRGHYFDKVFADHTGFDSRIDVTELVIGCRLF